MAPMRSDHISKIESLFSVEGWTHESPNVFLAPDGITSVAVDIEPDYDTVTFEFLLETLRSRGLGDLADRFHLRIDKI